MGYNAEEEALWVAEEAASKLASLRLKAQEAQDAAQEAAAWAANLAREVAMAEECLAEAEEQVRSARAARKNAEKYG